MYNKLSPPDWEGRFPITHRPKFSHLLAEDVELSLHPLGKFFILARRPAMADISRHDFLHDNHDR